MTSVPQNASVYDRIKERLDAADIIARLGLKLARTDHAEAYCAPLCHESSSGESLQVNLHTGVWNCKACQDAGYHGDLIQLVEYALSNGGAPTHGAAQRGSESHQAALLWLCEQYGIAYKPSEAYEDPALEVVHLFAMCAHEYLLTRPDMLAWIQAQWGFDLDTISSHSIGFMPDPILPELAREAMNPKSRAAFRQSGVGFFRGSEFVTRFAGRVIFPYLENGRAIYLIGRSTPSTPMLAEGRRPPKYHKLTVHTPERSWISTRITNDHLYNELVLRSTDRVVVAEGVADAVALSAIGVPVVSPVTISFNAVDLERFVRKVGEHSISRVEILFDNELSGSGNRGAREAGKKLVERGLTVTVITLPLGDTQEAARGVVKEALGDDVFLEFERAKPKRRKEIIEEQISEEPARQWIRSQVAASKIDAAEWVAAEGAAAPSKIDLLRAGGRDVVELEIDDDAAKIDKEGNPIDRINGFAESIELAAHVDELLLREEYARKIAKLAGKGITKAAVAQRISRARKTIVRPKREEAKEKKASEDRRKAPPLILPPPDKSHTQPSAPQPPPEAPEKPSSSCRPADGLSPAGAGAPPPPAPPEAKTESEHERFASARASVTRSIELKVPEEVVGEFVAQAIVDSMGYTPFLTADDLFLVRGNERVQVGLAHRTPEFSSVLFAVSGMTSQKSSHRSYIDVSLYFLKRLAQRAEDVSWSHVAGDGSVYFPTGDSDGRLLHIVPGKVIQTRMSSARVPAVTGRDFRPFEYSEEPDGMAAAEELFAWTSLAPSDRMILLHWVACLPLLRRIGTIPIVRIEGGAGSGKTRAVDAVSFLVNGGKSSCVPTAPALISQLASEMLTIDDNREVDGVDKTFLGTMLQATQLGARSKRRQHTDTGTVVERVAGALLMNGMEPIHNGKSELASRMLVMRCEPCHRAPQSPSANEALFCLILKMRGRFWSEATRRCSKALELDRVHGERLGANIEEIFGQTRIGRLSNYLRMMYLIAVAGLDESLQPSAIECVLPTWSSAFSSLGEYALSSLVSEELAVSAVKYALDFAFSESELPYHGADQREGCNGKYMMQTAAGDEVLGPMSAPQLARLVRRAGKELNAPRAVTSDLRAGQLEARVLDGIGFLESAGIHVDVERTRKGKIRFTFYREREMSQETPNDGSERWIDPDTIAP